MFSAFSTALSALQGDSTAVGVVGNDLANLNTNGYKAGSVSFADLMSQSLAGNTPNFGVAPPIVTRAFTQGAIQSSSGQLDAAIQGPGFFVVSVDGSQFYTRDGSFKVDSNGNLLTQNGGFVQGWSGKNGVVTANTPPGNIVIPAGTLQPPVATTTFTLGMNLDATAPLTGPNSTFAAPVQVVDSLGVTHNLTVTFNKTAANSWSYTVTADPADVSGGTPGQPVSLSTGNLAFSPDGQLTTPPAASGPVVVNVPNLVDGAAPLALNWNLYDPAGGAGNITQVAQPSAVASNLHDGSTAAQLTSLIMNDGGKVEAAFSNGKSSVIGLLAMASIRNPDSLVGAGQNLLAASPTTALPSVGLAGTGGRGQILGGSLEGSTVDIAQEFTKLIVYQRGYQANAKVITTTDQLSQETISLKQ